MKKEISAVGGKVSPPAYSQRRACEYTDPLESSLCLPDQDRMSPSPGPSHVFRGQRGCEEPLAEHTGISSTWNKSQQSKAEDSDKGKETTTWSGDTGLGPLAHLGSEKFKCALALFIAFANCRNRLFGMLKTRSSEECHFGALGEVSKDDTVYK